MKKLLPIKCKGLLPTIVDIAWIWLQMNMIVSDTALILTNKWINVAYN